MKRKFTFFGLIALAAVFAAKKRSDKERDMLSTEWYRISSHGKCGYHRFVFLSDLHEKTFGTDNERLLEQIRKVKPEAVLIGGDSIVSRHGMSADEDEIDVTVRLLEALKKEYPVFFALGNHEQRLFRKAAMERRSRERKNGDTEERQMSAAASAKRKRNANRTGKMEKSHFSGGKDASGASKKAAALIHALQGVTVLDNRTVDFGDVSISGISMEQRYFAKRPFGGKAHASASDIRKKAGIHRESGFHIFLLHTPLYFREAAAAGAELVLSGHFHGGTIRLPLLGGIMTPQYQFFVPECAGEFHRGQNSMIVSRGLGTHSINIRLNNRPELSVIEILGGDD